MGISCYPNVGESLINTIPTKYQDNYQTLLFNPLFYLNDASNLYNFPAFRTNTLTNPYNIYTPTNLQIDLMRQPNYKPVLPITMNYGISALWNNFFPPKYPGNLNSIYNFVGLGIPSNVTNVSKKPSTVSNPSSTSSSRKKIDDWKYNGSGGSSSGGSGYYGVYGGIGFGYSSGMAYGGGGGSYYASYSQA